MTNIMIVAAQSHAPSLEQLWRQAESMGRVEVDHAFGDSAYRVRIMFTRKGGSTIWAEGRDSNIAFAMSAAIGEAQKLGSL